MTFFFRRKERVNRYTASSQKRRSGSDFFFCLLLSREPAMRQSIEEMNGEGNTGHAGKKVTYRVDGLDSGDAEEVREQKDQRNEVETLAQTGQKRCLEALADRLEGHVAHDVDRQKRKDESFQTECPGSDGDDFRIIDEERHQLWGEEE